MRLLIIDNFDSFTYNLAQLFAALGDQVDVVVRRNDVPVNELAALRPDALCISPGPGTPRDSGVSREALRRWERELPILGVCLGMQVINEHYEGRTVHAPLPVHGKAQLLRHSGAGVFAGLPSPFRAARYHSLAVKRASELLVEDAWTDDGCVMALHHSALPIHAVQFHPESFMTEHGSAMAANFLALAGMRMKPEDPR
ncbi:aminodeoxychorismate/anthranilate synthase component II [bacterium]|nr:aminodeoxychorismate/anthranilate synthase component II [bacterium]